MVTVLAKYGTASIKSRNPSSKMRAGSASLRTANLPSRRMISVSVAAHPHRIACRDVIRSRHDIGDQWRGVQDGGPRRLSEHSYECSYECSFAAHRGDPNGAPPALAFGTEARD